MRYVNPHTTESGTQLTIKVSRDLAKTPGFSPTLNWVAVLLVALNPLTKLPLSLRPVCHEPC